LETVIAACAAPVSTQAIAAAMVTDFFGLLRMT